MRIVRRANQLGSDAHSIARFADAALHDILHAQSPRDLSDVDLLAAKSERGITRNHEQRAKAG